MKEDVGRLVEQTNFEECRDGNVEQAGQGRDGKVRHAVTLSRIEAAEQGTVLGHEVLGDLLVGHAGIETNHDNGREEASVFEQMLLASAEQKAVQAKQCTGGNNEGSRHEGQPHPTKDTKAFIGAVLAGLRWGVDDLLDRSIMSDVSW